MKKLLLLLMTGFCSPVIHAQQQTADFTGASEICFPDSLSRISEGSSDSLIYFTGGFVTPVHFAVNRDVPQPNDRLEPAFGLLDEIRHDPVYRLTYIWIGGSASPEGPADWNLRLGQRRADALTRLIGDQTGLSAEWFRTDNLGEDWTSFERMLASDRRILLHAGGQSRRLPSYAPSGKILTPIPVFRWERGQRLSQTLLDLQLPLYERLMRMAPGNIHTMVVSGDVYIRAAAQLPPVPDADVVCYGLWLDASIAKDHGVFVSDRRTPSVLRRMLQKPSVATLNELLQTGFYLTDIGVWMLSDRAVRLLRSRSKRGADTVEYDLYGEFGCSLGTDPVIDDPELRSLSVAVVPLPGGEFYHFGTSGEMISSMQAIQNIVNDQREIMHHGRKPHPSIFVQNAITEITITAENTNMWIENSHVGSGWTISHDNIITGVPRNDWHLSLGAGQCVDVVPVGEGSFAVRPYRIGDKFAGEEQQRRQFPVVADVAEMGRVLASMLAGGPAPEGCRLMSAEEISNEANLPRLVELPQGQLGGTGPQLRTQRFLPDRPRRRGARVCPLRHGTARAAAR